MYAVDKGKPYFIILLSSARQKTAASDMDGSSLAACHLQQSNLQNNSILSLDNNNVRKIEGRC